MFDQHVNRLLPSVSTQVVGLRYFNVYGPRESHKAGMASMVFHLHNQIKNQGKARLFGSSEHCNPGEQSRDFIAVDDVVKVNLWFLDHPHQSGIFNVGTGTNRSFNTLAKTIISYHQTGEIEYIPFPDALKYSYQEYTQANLTMLRQAGCDVNFKSLEQAVPKYLHWLSQNNLFQF